MKAQLLFAFVFLSSLYLMTDSLSAHPDSIVHIADEHPDDIQPYAENPWYWQYKQEPVLLRGGTDNDNLWQWTGKKLTDHLDLLTSLGGNYVRNTLSDRDEGNTYAFKKLSTGKYDLDAWNEAYWDKLEFFLKETAKRDIVVQLTIWDWFDLAGTNLDRHPLNPANNINLEEGSISEREDYYGGSLKNNNEALLSLQKKYVDKVLSLTFQYGHVLYNMSNESSLGEEWETFWAKYVREKAQQASKKVFLTSMHLVPSNGVRYVMSNRDLYDFAEISQNSQDSKGARGRAHYENVVRWRGYIDLSPEGPMPMNNEKIYGSADGRNYSAGHGKEAEDRFWKNVFGGAASVRFHRPEGYWGIGLTERAQVNIKAMDMFLEEFDLFSAGPFEGIHLIGESEGYALANIGKEYAVYFPAGRYAVELDPWIFAKKVSIKYLDIDSGTWSKEEIVELDWEEKFSELFGFRRGIPIKTPENKSCVVVVKVLE